MNDNTERPGWIPGKDAALADSIDRLQTRLRDLGFNIVEAAWLNPVPNVWSVNIRDADCALCFTNGKGASREAALASALGEYLERLACNYFFADFYMGPWPEGRDFYHYPQERWFPAGDDWHPELLADPALRAFYNPEDELTPSMLVDTNSGDAARGVCALRWVRIGDGETIWFPVNLIGNLYVSNGMSAGNSREEARVQAMSELFERSVKARVIKDRIALPDVPESVLARYPAVVEGIEALRAHGFGVLVRDASLGGRYPVINVTLLDPASGGVFASFGAHPRFAVALERTLTELLQGRGLDQLGEFAGPSFDEDAVASHENIETHFIDSAGLLHWRFFSDTPDVDFADWDFGGSTSEEYQWLCRRFAEDRVEVYVADLEHLGFYACRIIAPGLSEIYPPEDLVWDNNNAAVRWRETLLGLNGADDAALAALADWLDEQAWPEHLPVAAMAGLAPDPGTPWAALRIGHLQLWLALALGRHEELDQLTQWAIDFGESAGESVQLFSALQAVAGLAASGLREPAARSLEMLFPMAVLTRAMALYEGRERFPDLDDPGLALDGLPLHGSLRAAFDKLRAAMDSG